MSRREGYDKYISSSPVWAEKREARKEIDGHKCRTCHHDGSEDRLEVHHAHYDSFKNEDVENDLITLCSRCHDAITNVFRHKKYEERGIDVDDSDLVSDLDLVLPKMEEDKDESQDFESEAYRSLSPYIAQQPTGEPDEQMGSHDERDFIEAKKG